jgi:hypothetical protein
MTKKRLGELLLQEGVVNDEQLKEALEEQQQTGELIGEILVRKGFVTESDIARTISTQFSFPYISVLNYYIAPDMTEIFPLEMLEKHLFVPIDRFGDVLSIVVAGLLEQEIVSEIEKKSDCTAQVYVGMVSEVKQIIKDKFASTAAAKAKGDKKAAASGAAETAVTVDVTAPPKKEPVAKEDRDEELVDLSEAILAAEESVTADESVAVSGPAVPSDPDVDDITPAVEPTIEDIAPTVKPAVEDIAPAGDEDLDEEEGGAKKFRFFEEDD